MRVLGMLLMVFPLAASPVTAQSFVNFESGHVRPLALSPDGARLFAVNTPDNRVAVFDVTPAGLSLVAEVAVGLEPVAVATRTNGAGRVEAWVVNHLSDSVSIVEVDPIDPALSRVTGTLLVGDEPRDVVFGGPGFGRAFVTTARRGQNLPPTIPAENLAEGTPRALLWVFAANDPFADTPLDANAAASPLGGEPLTVLQLFTDAPRALAVTPDGSTVYAAGFKSGNRTAIVPERTVGTLVGANLRVFPPPPPDSPFTGPCDPFGNQPGPTPAFPCTGLVVRFDPATGAWRDELGQDWGIEQGFPLINFSLPDSDVFAIDATQDPPVELASITGVGTVLFDMAVRPGTGQLFVTNTEARNDVRFEALVAQGPGDPVQGVRGHIAESRITVVTGTTPLAVHLNPHVDYGVTPGPSAEIAESMSFPLGMAFSTDGGSLYVAAFGSGTVAAYDAAALATGAVVKDLVPVGGGPTGVVVDAGHDRLYVMTRFEQRIAIVTNASNPALRATTDSASLRYDPSPATVKYGRPFLYDARRSGHGDSACASCHVFGDKDNLAWDLGNPYGAMADNPNPFILVCDNDAGRECATSADCDPPGQCVTTGARRFHPMKGPMTTQSLRGMSGAGPMHWRGDRTGGTTGGDPLDEVLAFKAFNVAFEGLLGMASEIPDADMQAFTDFILTVRYPPNPNRTLDNQGTPQEQLGRDLFVNRPTLGGFPCDGCHTVPLGTEGVAFPDAEPQDFKIPHLRNVYDKVGMFGASPFVPFGVPIPPAPLGDQIAGFGLIHDGAIPSIGDFVDATVFGNLSPSERDAIKAFILGWSEEIAPAVGQQVTSAPASVADPATLARRDLLVARAAAGDCDVVLKTVFAGEQRGAVYAPGIGIVSDRGEVFASYPAVWDIGGTPGQEQVWTCVPPGSGVRVGIDRDEDGFLDRVELDAGSDPADPLSVPGGPTVVRIPTRSMKLKDGSLAGLPHKRKLSFKSTTYGEPPETRIVAPATGSAGDPTLHGARLRVYNGAGSGEQVTIDLPAGGWSVGGHGGFEFKDASLGAAVQRVTARNDLLKVKAGKTGWPYTLNEATQGRMVLRMSLGSAVQWCAEAPAKLSGTPPSPARNDRRDLFKGASKTPAPLACQAPPAG